MNKNINIMVLQENSEWLRGVMQPNVKWKYSANTIKLIVFQ